MSSDDFQLFGIIGGLIYVIGCGALAAWLADIKGRDTVGWFLLGVLFNLAAVIAIAGVPVVKFPRIIACPKCQTELQLSNAERLDGRARCPECDHIIDMIELPTIKSDSHNKENSEKKDKK